MTSDLGVEARAAAGLSELCRARHIVPEHLLVGLDQARGTTPGRLAKDMLDPTGTFDAPAGPIAPATSGQGSPRPADAAMPRVEPEPPEPEDAPDAPKTGQTQAGS